MVCVTNMNCSLKTWGLRQKFWPNSLACGGTTTYVHNLEAQFSTVQPSSWGTWGAYFACISSIYKWRTKKVVYNNCHSTFFILIYSSSLPIRQNDDIKAVKFHNVYSTCWVVLSFNDILVCFSMHTSSCARMAVITFSMFGNILTRDFM